MSKLNVLAFDLRIRGDKNLQSRVKTLPANDADGLVRLGAEVGFTFSSSELLEVIGATRPSEELSENELEQVAGGAINTYLPSESLITLAFSPEYTRNIAKPGSSPKAQ